MKSKVLIVDDDPAMLRLLEDYLVDAGHEVLQASNGEEAFKVALSEAPPIVITDWLMPKVDGIQLCRMLRGHEGVRFVYIIFVTVLSESNRVMEAFEAGADDYLAKPVRKCELLARVRAAEHIARLESDLAKRTLDMHRLNAEMAVANERLALANDRLKMMATTDELTGLVNRREALNRLGQLWAADQRYGQHLSCIMLDVDNFKKVNDTYGHAVGDSVLRETAAVLRMNVRTTDSVCRIGGEEFLVLCPNVGAAWAAVCAERLRTALETCTFTHDGASLKETISLGVAERLPGMKCMDDLLKLADQALYASKQAGRNRVTVAEGCTDPALA